jgi:hypothetical protein
MLILEVSDEHDTRRMCDGEGHACRCNHRLRRHTTGPEHRDLVILDLNGIAVIRLVDVLDADRLWQTEM